MTLIVDAAPLVALADRRDPMRKPVRDLLHSETGQLVVPAPVSAEVDYLLAKRLGEAARQAFLEDLAVGRFAVECLEPYDYPEILELERRFEALQPGLADLSIVVLADRFGTRRIATFDRRHFRSLRAMRGDQPFELLPYG